MTCEFAHEDAAYVLGALSSAERAAFQEHLAGCAECSQAVRRLSGLPGLLSRVSLDVLEAPAPEEPVPDTLLPALVAEARRVHAGPSRPAHSSAFADAASRIVARVGELQDHQIAVEIQRLMAMLGDGHSLLYPMPSERNARTPAVMSALIPAHVVCWTWGMYSKSARRRATPAVRPK